MTNKYLEKIASTRFIKEIIKKSPGLGKSEVNAKITSAYRGIASKNNANLGSIHKSDNAINRRAGTQTDTYATKRRVMTREDTSNLYGSIHKKS